MPSPKGYPHDSAIGHVQGLSEFIDDRPLSNQEIHVGIVFSTEAHAKIKLNFANALKNPAVVGVFTHKDLAHNRWGTIFQDQPVLAENEVYYVGQPICVVAARSFEAMLDAKKLVQINYSKLKALLSIDEAKAKKAFIGPLRHISCGSSQRAYRESDFKHTGQLRIKGQEHFYLESQCAIAYPSDDSNIEVISSSQHPSEVQHLVAHTLGLRLNQVVCVVKRMGGAFGGKESQAAPIALMAALVTQKTGKPARIVLNKDEDMLITGKRNPFQNDYQFGFNKKGLINALEVDLFSDGGAYADLSTSIMERAMLHCDNAYHIPNARFSGQVCRTNFHPSTAFRGFGGPKGVATIEGLIEDAAHLLQKDSLDIRKLNCYKKGQSTPYGQIIDQNMLPRLFDKLEKKCEYRKRREAIKAFNANSHTHVRGLSMTAVKFGISFTTRFLNQGNALVNIHLDGTIQVSTGATEMGQGVNNKIAVVVSEALGLEFNDVKVMPTSTEKNHNTSPTAASSGSDINCAAALDACEKLKKRLSLLAELVFSRPQKLRGHAVAGAGTAIEIKIDEVDFKTMALFENGKVKIAEHSIAFAELVEEAYLNRISLGAYGFFKYPGIEFNKEKGQGNPFFYFTNGVAASEVDIDRLTGELKVLQTDILMDLGRPINEAIDYGQVSGGFIQGMGWVTTENLYYDKCGYLKSHSPTTYKIPNIQDLPRVFNIDFEGNDENIKNVRGSKAVGEPPLLLALSVWTATKNALNWNRDPKKPVRLNIPATQEEIFFRLEELDH